MWCSHHCILYTFRQASFILCVGKVPWLRSWDCRAWVAAVQREGGGAQRDYRTIESRALDPHLVASFMCFNCRGSPCKWINNQCTSAPQPYWHWHMDCKSTHCNAYAYIYNLIFKVPVVWGTKSLRKSTTAASCTHTRVKKQILNIDF